MTTHNGILLAKRIARIIGTTHIETMLCEIEPSHERALFAYVLEAQSAPVAHVYKHFGKSNGARDRDFNHARILYARCSDFRTDFKRIIDQLNGTNGIPLTTKAER